MGLIGSEGGSTGVSLGSGLLLEDSLEDFLLLGESEGFGNLGDSGFF